jgi:D-alanyl-D-alanine dipeptidase
MLLRTLLALLATATMARTADLSKAIPTATKQLVLVTTASWADSKSTLQRYARSKVGGSWTPVGRPIPALVGEGGLAWGHGLHEMPRKTERLKREGDRCAPAGVFRITSALGQVSPAEAGPLRLPYRLITPTLEAVDDPSSRFYNQIVDRAKVARPDWHSAELLAKGRHYRLALALGHNPQNIPGAGSCIFIHEWIGQRTGTAGCTVLRRAALLELIRWLDASAQPVLVQAPEGEAPRF